ncbi:cation channel family protein (macronuclear) [Tetrahymena thermophila SB210]|uniref:Cation channel family protein n=1 Tax=Tetrahymena thermophila (strain SB210) TaxID=312017 RepID=Q22D28_TETTS|nr:cation channel family protein [Tetrahymena thermophila SB210]EAR83225.2 cation channel family protein [Tetrahymena thermophila SB210]|eukprot:XP_001030888.2 cation channel family protein [Tetrahymena thermophila SB210]
MIEQAIFKQNSLGQQNLINEPQEVIAQDINTLKTICVDQYQMTQIDKRESKNQILPNNVNEQNTIKDNSDELANQPSVNFKKQITLFQNRKWQYVAKFIQKIKQQSSLYRFGQTRKSQLDIIDDKSFFYDYFYYQKRFTNEMPSLFESFAHYLETREFIKFLKLRGFSNWIIMPDHLPSRLWNFVQFFFLLIYIIYLPIRIAFDSLYQNNQIFILFEVIPNIIQIINIFLQLNTGFYKRGVVITDRSQIIKHYLFSVNFYFDMFLCIFWLISLNNGVSIWFKVVGVLRLFTFIHYLSQIEYTTDIREYIGSYLDLIKLGGFIFLCAHLTGCCFYALANYEKELGVFSTWIDKDRLNFVDNENSVNLEFQGYVASFYWSIITMCTVGYGDVVPTTFRERIFVVFVCMLACFLFAFAMNSIGEIIKNLRQNNEEFKLQTTSLKIYMKKRKLPKSLQMRVRKYYEYLYAEKKQENELGIKLIDDLAPTLRSDVLKEMYSNILKKQKLFNLNFSETFITNLYKYVKEKKYSVDEYLFKENEKSENLFFILSGEVEIILQNRVVLQTLQQGEFVGSQEFFGDNLYQFSAKANTFTQFLIIDKQDFIESLKNFENDYESFCEIRDNINLQHKNSALCIRCESCSQYGHTFQGCSMIKFHGNKYKQIFNYNKIKQSRKKQSRNDFTFTTLQCAKEVEESVKAFHEHVYYTQLQKEEFERNLYKNFSTIDDNEDSDESEKEKTEQNQRQIGNFNNLQNQIAENQNTGIGSRLTINLNNQQSKEEHSIENEQKDNQRLKVKSFVGQNDSKKPPAISSFFAREQLQVEKTQNSQDTDNESESFDINNPSSPEKIFYNNKSSEGKIQEIRISTTPNKKQQYSSKAKTAAKLENANSKQHSYFFSYSLKDNQDNEIKTTHNSSKNDEYKESLKSNKIIYIEDQVQQGSQQNIVAQTHKPRFFTKKNDLELRRKSKFLNFGNIQGAQLNKQVSIQLCDSSNASPAKKIPFIQGILSPKSNPISPKVSKTPINQNQKTPAITPKHYEKRLTIRHQSQFSNSLASIVYNIYEQAIQQENLISKKLPMNQEVENEFDRMKEYQHYFINNNPSQVVLNYNKYAEERKRCYELMKGASLRKKKKNSQKTRYEKKNFNMLNKRNQTLKSASSKTSQQQGNQFKKISVDWSKYNEEVEKPQEINKQELDSLINNQNNNQ